MVADAGCFDGRTRVDRAGLVSCPWLAVGDNLRCFVVVGSALCWLGRTDPVWPFLVAIATNLVALWLLCVRDTYGGLVGRQKSIGAQTPGDCARRLVCLWPDLGADDRLVASLFLGRPWQLYHDVYRCWAWHEYPFRNARSRVLDVRRG